MYLPALTGKSAFIGGILLPQILLVLEDLNLGQQEIMYTL
jgi:hypothetical protein